MRKMSPVSCLSPQLCGPAFQLIPAVLPSHLDALGRLREMQVCAPRFLLTQATSNHAGLLVTWNQYSGLDNQGKKGGFGDKIRWPA